MSTGISWWCVFLNRVWWCWCRSHTMTFSIEPYTYEFPIAIWRIKALPFSANTSPLLGNQRHALIIEAWTVRPNSSVKYPNYCSTTKSRLLPSIFSSGAKSQELVGTCRLNLEPPIWCNSNNIRQLLQWLDLWFRENSRKTFHGRTVRIEKSRRMVFFRWNSSLKKREMPSKLGGEQRPYVFYLIPKMLFFKCRKESVNVRCFR
jgi:hypothetical protein